MYCICPQILPSLKVWGLLPFLLQLLYLMYNTYTLYTHTMWVEFLPFRTTHTPQKRKLQVSGSQGAESGHRISSASHIGRRNESDPPGRARIGYPLLRNGSPRAPIGSRIKTWGGGVPRGSQEAPPSDLGVSHGELLLYTSHAMVGWLGIPVVKMPARTIKKSGQNISDHFLDWPECLETKTSNNNNIFQALRHAN